MLVRATARRQQTSVRSALGAARGTLVGQALTESIVLAVMGGIAGIAIAFAVTRMILTPAFGNGYVPIDALPVLGFAFGASLLTGILFGIAPAWLTAKADPAEALRGAARSTGRNTARGQNERHHVNSHIQYQANQGWQIEPVVATLSAKGERNGE